jgi:nicotinic acid phosphoribosyltransferase
MITQNDIDWLKANGFKEDANCHDAHSGLNTEGKVWKKTFQASASEGWRGYKHRFYCIVFYSDLKYHHGWLCNFGKEMKFSGGQTYNSAYEAVWYNIFHFQDSLRTKIAKLCEENVCAAIAEGTIKTPRDLGQC